VRVFRAAWRESTARRNQRPENELIRSNQRCEARGGNARAFMLHGCRVPAGAVFLPSHVSSALQPVSQ
jgi:hypothetical protein